MHPGALGRKARILIVEDNPADARLIREALKEIGVPVEISIAKDGDEALDFVYQRGQHARAARPDLILLDLNLPRRSGHEVLEDIKNNPAFCSIPVVVLSSSRADKDVTRAYRSHANCYVPKPGTLDQVQEVMQSIENFWLHRIMLPPDTQAA